MCSHTQVYLWFCMIKSYDQVWGKHPELKLAVTCLKVKSEHTCTVILKACLPTELHGRVFIKPTYRWEMPTFVPAHCSSVILVGGQGDVPMVLETP